jgi:Fur family iron response transcriptional regulator
MATPSFVPPALQAADPAGRSTGRSGCPVHDLRARLRTAGLRPTRQRVGLGWLLFAKGDRHVTAEMLFDEASRARVPVSLATVYNTLHQFTEAGLLREVAVDGAKTYFDTNTGNHHHFFVEGENALFDIEGPAVEIGVLPEPPEGMEIARVDVIVRLRPKSRG